jgi:hypothetical protein
MHARRLVGGVHSAWHDRVVSWPPQIGELLPRPEDAYGVEDKLAAYSLNPDHPRGGSKARVFASALAITADDVVYLADALRTGIRSVTISAVRERGEHGVHCEVIVPVRGLRNRDDAEARVLTAWELPSDGDAPRLVSAYITTKVT